MTDTQNFRERLGRWLCYQFYRDPTGLQQIDGVHGIFEEVCRLDQTWFELLAGAFRYPQLSTTKRAWKNAAGAKWSKLGEVVRPGQTSIDGVGEVRAKEVLLYLAVAERFEALLNDEV